ncbi:MAG: hypothetical protein C4534_05110 [Gaiellales bacterium]|nr:MAG: hypothetical protein C4534_05110 [Gaiellales bacterium]
MPANEYRQKSAFLLAVMLLMAMIGWMSLGMRVTGTWAYFSDSATSTGNSFRAGNFDPLVLSPGTSKETYVNRTGPFRTIARVEEGRFFLDFGEVAQGNANNSPDVFRIRNSDSVPLNVTFELSPELAPYFEFVRLKDGGSAVAPGQTRGVEMKLVTGKEMPAGAHAGELRIKSGPGKIDKVVPVYFVVCKQPTSGAAAAGAAPADVGVAAPAVVVEGPQAEQSLGEVRQAAAQGTGQPLPASPNPGAPVPDTQTGAPDPIAPPPGPAPWPEDQADT